MSDHIQFGIKFTGIPIPHFGRACACFRTTSSQSKGKVERCCVRAAIALGFLQIVYFSSLAKPTPPIKNGTDTKNIRTSLHWYVCPISQSKCVVRVVPKKFKRTPRFFPHFRTPSKFEYLAYQHQPSVAIVRFSLGHPLAHLPVQHRPVHDCA